MINDEYKKNLQELAEKIYTKEEKAFADRLLIVLGKIRLEESSVATGYFINANTKDDRIKTLLISNFGKKIIENIELLQRIGKISFPETQKSISQLRKLFIELSDDISIIFIKLAERLTSLKIAEEKNSPELKKFSEENLYFYSPIAQMLGIRKFYTEMEDIAFKNLFPTDFEYLDKMIEQKKQMFNTKLNIMKLDLEKVLMRNKIDAKIQSRVKRPYSIFRKLVKQKIPLDKIYDLLALRVITQSPESCYLTLGVVHSNWIPIEGRFRDWITFPKANGYRSIQTTVYTRTGDKFEVQIRTEEMHQEAEYGSSAHWAYKQNQATASDIWINRLREFLENDEYFDNPYEVFDKLKADLKRDYINVLTPKGEIKSLPEGSTPVDYAFSVHTDLGYKVTGARVNGKFIKLATTLKSGDVIDIIASNKEAPSRDWLSFVKTTRARSKILRWFKKNEQAIFILEGRNSWEKLKVKHRKKLVGFEDEQKLKNNLNKIGFKSFDDFFYALSSGSMKCTLYTLKKLYPDAFKKVVDETQKIKKYKEDNHIPRIRVEGLDNIATVLAKCCNPLKGEQIIAYVTKKSEIKIHSQNCPYLKNLDSESDSFKHAEWQSGEFLQVANLKIYGTEYGKILAYIVDASTSESTKILSTIKIPSKVGLEGMQLEIEVRDLNHLQKFTNKVKNNPGIISIKSS